jgi:hypothetical protein
MRPSELRASISLASIFGLRLFGMFVILPVFALYAEGRPGWNLTLVGIALGAYGLTQAVLQIPFGWLSDRHGRKPVLYFGLALFALGSFACAVAETPWAVIAGPVLQGAGGDFGRRHRDGGRPHARFAAHQGHGHHRLDHRGHLCRVLRGGALPAGRHRRAGHFRDDGRLRGGGDGGGRMGRPGGA